MLRGIAPRRLLPVLARRPRRAPPARTRSLRGGGAPRDRGGRPLRGPQQHDAARGHGGTAAARSSYDRDRLTFQAVSMAAFVAGLLLLAKAFDLGPLVRLVLLVFALEW